MLCAPAVACEISAPPTTPRGTSRSGPGLTTLMGPSLRVVKGLDPQRRLFRSRMVDLKGDVAQAEPLLEHLLERPSSLVAVIAGPHHDVCRQCRKAGGHLPYVQVVDLDHARLSGERLPDLLRLEARRRSLHEHPSRGLEQSIRSVQHQRADN